MKVGMMEPMPGRMPRKKPSVLPRAMGMAESFQSCFVGSSPWILGRNTSCLMPSSMFSSTSATPNTPMIIGTRPRPSESVMVPYVNRGVAVMGSRPTVPRKRPSSAIAAAFSRDPLASHVTIVKPMSSSAKISGGPKPSARRASGGASSMIPSTLSEPAMNEPKAAMPRAAPARPWRAIR
jgi:hypothetical protein